MTDTQPEGRGQRRPTYDDHPYTAFVSGPITDTTEDELFSLFSAIASITGVVIPQSKKCAFVKFETAEGLKKAMEASVELASGGKLTVEERRIFRGHDNKGRGGGAAGAGGFRGGRGHADRRFSRGGRGAFAGGFRQQQ